MGALVGGIAEKSHVIVWELAPEHGGLISAITLTGCAREKYRTQAESAGFQSYMAKPFQIHALVDAIASLIERPAPT
jgi:CheY-like chemotaxis protein